VTTAPRLARRLSALDRSRMERGVRIGSVRRPGPAARHQRRPVPKSGAPRTLAFGLCPLLTLSAIEALDAHGSEELKKIYLEKLISGAWTGTMQLTEPQAGSGRRGAFAAAPSVLPTASLRASGTKIFITYGDHDMTDNIVLSCWRDCPMRPRAPKAFRCFLVRNSSSTPMARSARATIFIRAAVEHKLGIHASPTCTMTMGDKGGAIGYLIGEDNRGMLCMFTMMNQARLSVGLEGVGIADRAYQQALAFAQERRQGHEAGSTGNGMDPIIVHPDIKRMLMQMRALTAAARTICYATAVALDISIRATDGKTRSAAAARGALLTADCESILLRYPATRSQHSACRSMAAWDSSRSTGACAALSRCAHHHDL